MLASEKDSVNIEQNVIFIVPPTVQGDTWNGKAGVIDAETVQPSHVHDTKSPDTDDKPSVSGTDSST